MINLDSIEQICNNKPFKVNEITFIYNTDKLVHIDYDRAWVSQSLHMTRSFCECIRVASQYPHEVLSGIDPHYDCNIGEPIFMRFSGRVVVLYTADNSLQGFVPREQLVALSSHLQQNHSTSKWRRALRSVVEYAILGSKSHQVVCLPDRWPYTTVVPQNEAIARTLEDFLRSSDTYALLVMLRDILALNLDKGLLGSYQSLAINLVFSITKYLNNYDHIGEN